MKVVRTAALVAWSLALPARADILVWRDASGVSHYTTDIANVPQEFRGGAITVAKDWARPEPPPEPAAEPIVTSVSTSEPEEEETEPLAAGDVFEAGYAAGLRAAVEPAPSASASVGTVVQNVEVLGDDRRERLLPYPVLVERRPSRAHRRAERARDDRNPLPPARPAPFLQGPAGPPPVTFRD